MDQGNFKIIMPSHHTKSKVACSSAQAYRRRFDMRAIFFWLLFFSKKKSDEIETIKK